LFLLAVSPCVNVPHLDRLDGVASVKAFRAKLFRPDLLDLYNV
jgi:hypothetical protein